MTSSILGFVSKIIKISKLKTQSAPRKYDTNLILDRPDFAMMLLVILKFQILDYLMTSSIQRVQNQVTPK